MLSLIRVFTLSFLFAIFSLVTSNKSEEQELVVNCSAIILNNIKYDQNHNFVHVFSRDLDDFTSSILKLLQRPVVLSEKLIAPLGFQELSRLFPLAYLVYGTNLTLLQDIFQKINITHSTWHPRTKFVILTPQNIDLKSKEEFLNLIAELLFNINIYNFVVLFPSPIENQVNIYKWNPYGKIGQCGNYIKFQIINKCDGNKLETRTPLFQMNKLLAGCTFRVGAFNWPPYTFSSEKESDNFINGYNVLTMHALSHMFKIKVKFIPIDDNDRWGMLLNNGTWTGGLGTLQNNKADAVIGGCLQTHMRFLAFDCSPTFTPLTIKFYLALPGKLPHWKNMLYIFSLEFWIALIITYLITSIFIFIFSQVIGDEENNYYRNFSNCLLSLWRISVGTSTNIVPVSKIVRSVFLLWVIYCFHITSLYSSALLGVITTPFLEEPMKSLNELAKTNLPLLLVPQFVQVSSKMDAELQTIISKKFQEFKPENGKDIDRMITKKDIVILDPEEHFEIKAQEKLFSIYSLEETIRLNPGIYFRRGSIFLEHVNIIQYLTLENGMFSKWKQNLTGAYRFKRHQRNNYENEILPLTSEKLSGSFYILSIGLVLSTIIFVLEQVIFQYQQAKCKKCH